MSAPITNRQKTIPVLENGYLLSRGEFERRYQAMPHLKKAELIEGIVYMGSPLRFESHAEPHANLFVWLGNYKIATPGLRLGDNRYFLATKIYKSDFGSLMQAGFCQPGGISQG